MKVHRNLVLFAPEGEQGSASTVPAATSAPANLVAPELNENAIGDFVRLAEEGGLMEGREDFPDLPATSEAGEVSVPPAQNAPAVKPVTEVVEERPTAVPTPAQPSGVPAQAQSAAEAVPAASVQQGVSTPASTTAGLQAPAAAPQAAPATPVATPTIAAAAKVEEVASDPFAALASQLNSQVEAFTSALADQMYSISSEDHEAFLAGDSKKLSQLCARIHMNSVNSVLNSISKLMPVMVNGLLQVQRDTDSREERFWDVNKHLSKTAHRALIAPVLRTYNQLNPGVDEAKRFRDVGLLVAQMHNIPLSAQATQVAQQALGTSAVRTPGPIVKTVEAPGFAPASAGGSPAPVANGGPRNPWEGLVDFAMANEKGLFDS